MKAREDEQPPYLNEQGNKEGEPKTRRQVGMEYCDKRQR